MRRVGLNCLYLVPRAVGGTEIYARRLIEALALERPDVEWVVFCGREAAAVLPDPAWAGNVRVHALPVRAAVKPARLAAELGLLPRVARAQRVELLHSLGTTSPLHGAGPRVVTVHDLIYHHYPGTFPLAARLGLELLVPRGARRAARVQVSSHATKAEVVELLALDPDRVDVVHLGLGMAPAADPTPAAALRAAHGLGDAPLVLSVAAALPHKNLDRLLRAFAHVQEATLVLVGHAGRDTERLRGLAAALGIGERVRFTGWVSDSDLEGLYGAADAFVYPSLHEGFGLPVLEAMRRGVPVACADATSLPEVAGDAALLFDPLAEQAIAAAVSALLAGGEDVAARVARGRERAAGFGWDRTARAALASYELALSAPAR
jgi:glycosyltransferase involved in cell wall biosynthesis